MSMRNSLSFFAAVIAVAMFAGSASASYIINLQIEGSGPVLNGLYGTGVGEYLAPVPYTGSTWNRGSTSGTNLIDSDGNATTVDFTLLDTRSGGSGPADNAWMEALNGYRYKNVGAGTPATIVFDGLTQGASYDIYFILQGNNNEGGLVSMTAGANPFPASAISLGTEGRTASQGGPASAYIEGVNFATQSFVATGTSATFSLDDNGVSNFMALAGVQIVEVIPEPASLVMLGLGSLLIAVRRRV